MLVLLVLVAPLRPDVGLAAGLIALAIGHHPSVLQPFVVARWRFSFGQIWPLGVIQIVAAIAIGMAVAQTRVWMLLVLTVYFLSLAIYGNVWDRKR